MIGISLRLFNRFKHREIFYAHLELLYSYGPISQPLPAGLGLPSMSVVTSASTQPHRSPDSRIEDENHFFRDRQTWDPPRPNLETREISRTEK